MSITAQDMVSREVHYCVSGLVHTLATGAGSVENSARGFDRGRGDEAAAQLASLCEKALELSMPIEDYEEAAIQEGWRIRDDGCLTRDMLPSDEDEAPVCDPGDWQDACNVDDIGPYEREIFEHWIVSDWLADKLEAKGERVDKDFEGLTIWGRTTTGQAIYMDSVIEEIHADLVK